MSGKVRKIIENVMLGLFVVVVISLSTTGCEKPNPPRAEVTVIDSSGIAVNEARVVLYCVQRPEESRECVIVDTQYTDDVGKAEFEFENPSVLKLEVWKADVTEMVVGQWPNDSVVQVGDTLCADGFVTLEIDQVVEERVVVSLCNSGL